MDDNKRDLREEEEKMEETNKIQCKHCGEYFDECDVRLIDTREGEDYHVCENCYCDNYMTCDDCDCAILLDEDDYIVDASGNYICEDCRDNYRLCSRCEEYYHEEDMHWHEGSEEWFCDGCYEECNCDEDLDEVSYRMRELDKDTTYLGFELEVGSEDYGDSQLSYQIRNILGREYLLNIHHDGSICEDGVKFGGEIVSQPLTIEQINSKDFRDKMQRVVDLLLANGLMQKCYTCGFHVHFTRKGNEDISKLYLLSNYFKDELKAIGGRYNCTNWCEILNTSTNYEELRKTFDNVEESRYVFWNRQNEKTIECRAFESNLDVDIIIQRLNVVYRCALLSRQQKHSNITWRYLTSGDVNVRKNDKVLSIDTVSYFKKIYVEKYRMERIRSKINKFAREYIIQLVEEQSEDCLSKIKYVCRGVEDIMTRKTIEGVIVRTRNNQQYLPQNLVDYVNKLNYVKPSKDGKIRIDKLMKSSVVRIKNEDELSKMLYSNHQFEVPRNSWSSYKMLPQMISEIAGKTYEIESVRGMLFDVGPVYYKFHTDLIDEVILY